MSSTLTIVLGTHDLLAPLQSRPEITSGTVRYLPPEDIRTAIETILSQLPTYVVLPNEFLTSARGTAMIERLQADPDFTGAEILVVNGSEVARLAVAPDSDTAAHLDWRGNRRMPRIRMAAGLEVQVDGTAAQLIDLSTIGAQVVSPAPLKPNQRVRFSLPAETGARGIATVAWVSFEMSPGKPTPHYRAGLEFANPDARAIEQFCVEHAFVESSKQA